MNDNDMAMKPMKMKDLFKYLVMMFKARIPVCLVADAGTGKTTMARDLAAYLKCKLIEIHAVSWDSTELKGFPAVVDGKAVFLPYGSMRDLFNSGEDIILLFDDLLHGKPDTIKAFMQMIRGRLGDMVIPSNVYIMCATNDPTQKSGAVGMPEPLKSSMVLLHVQQDNKSSLEWFEKNGFEDEMLSFLQCNPEYIHRPNPTMQLTKSPCGREWARANESLRVFKAAMDQDFIDKAYLNSILETAICGCVGPEAARMFSVQWEIIGTLPSVGDVMADPVGVSIPLEPENTSALYMLCTVLCKAFAPVDGATAEINTPNNRDALWTLIERIPRAFQRLMISELEKADPTFSSMPQRNKFRSILNENIDRF